MKRWIDAHQLAILTKNPEEAERLVVVQVALDLQAARKEARTMRGKLRTVTRQRDEARDRVLVLEGRG